MSNLKDVVSNFNKYCFDYFDKSEQERLEETIESIKDYQRLLKACKLHLKDQDKLNDERFKEDLYKLLWNQNGITVYSTDSVKELLNKFKKYLENMIKIQGLLIYMIKLGVKEEGD